MHTRKHISQIPHFSIAFAQFHRKPQTFTSCLTSDTESQALPSLTLCSANVAVPILHSALYVCLAPSCPNYSSRCILLRVGAWPSCRRCCFEPSAGDRGRGLPKQHPPRSFLFLFPPFAPSLFCSSSFPLFIPLSLSHPSLFHPFLLPLSLFPSFPLFTSARFFQSTGHLRRPALISQSPPLVFLSTILSASSLCLTLCDLYFNTVASLLGCLFR